MKERWRKIKANRHTPGLPPCSSAGPVEAGRLVGESRTSVLTFPEESLRCSVPAGEDLALLVPFGFELPCAEDEVGGIAGEDFLEPPSVPICMGLRGPSDTGDDACVSSTKPRHFRQPSKSIKACMHPHSVTFCSNHSNRTGYGKLKHCMQHGSCKRSVRTLVKKSLQPAASAS